MSEFGGVITHCINFEVDHNKILKILSMCTYIHTYIHTYNDVFT